MTRPPYVPHWRIGMAGWRLVLRRTWAEAGDDNISLIAAGTAFYAFSSIAPLLAAAVLIYGLAADPATVADNIRALFQLVPKTAATVIGDQLTNVVQTSGGKKGFGLIVAIGIALYGAMKAATSVMTALNIAYEEREGRGIVRLYVRAIVLTAGAVLMLFAAVAMSAILAYLRALIPGAPGIVLGMIRIVGYLGMAVIVMTGAAGLYRFGPDRDHPRWIWCSPGAVLATMLWIAATAAFGAYVSNFSSYGATYGSLGAVVVLLTWLWLSAYLFLLGAEMNSEIERRAAIAKPRPDAGSLAPVAPVQPVPAAPASRHGDAKAAIGIATVTAAALIGWVAGLRRR